MNMQTEIRIPQGGFKLAHLLNSHRCLAIIASASQLLLAPSFRAQDNCSLPAGAACFTEYKTSWAKGEKIYVQKEYVSVYTNSPRVYAKKTLEDYHYDARGATNYWPPPDCPQNVTGLTYSYYSVNSDFTCIKEINKHTAAYSVTYSGSATHHSEYYDDLMSVCPGGIPCSVTLMSRGETDMTEIPVFIDGAWNTHQSGNMWSYIVWGSTNCTGADPDERNIPIDNYPGVPPHLDDPPSGLGSLSNTLKSTEFTYYFPQGFASAKLDIEYTDGELHQKVANLIPPFVPDPEGWGSDEGLLSSSTYSYIYPGRTWGELQAMKYRFCIPGSIADVDYTVTYNLATFDSDGGISIGPQLSAHVRGTGNMSGLAYSEPKQAPLPSWYSNLEVGDGYIFTKVINVSASVSSSSSSLGMPGSGPSSSSTSSGAQCSNCGQVSRADAGAGLSIVLGMGQITNGILADGLQVLSTAPSLTLATPAGLIYNITTNFDVVIRSNQVRQIMAPQALADIVTNNDFSYDIRYYLPSQVTSKSDGLYQISGTPYVTWRVENPDASTNTFNRLQLTEIRNGSNTVYSYSFETASGSWTASLPGNVAQMESATNYVLVTNIVNGNPEIFTQIIVTNTVRKPGSSDYLSQVRYVYRYDDQYEEYILKLLEQTVDPGGNPKTTSYTYDNQVVPTLSAPGVQLITHPDGSWQYYTYAQFEYNSAHNPNKVQDVYSGFADQAPPVGTAPDVSNCRHTYYDYTPVISSDSSTNLTYTPRMTVEYVKNVEIARSYVVVLPGERRDIRCQEPGANWNAGANLVTITKYYTNGPNLYRVASVENPDGTMQFYQYDQAADGTRTTTVYSGHPNGGNIDDGTQDITVVGPLGQMISHQVIDIASTKTISSETYGSYDEFNRPQQITYLDGTSSQTHYACCGIDNTIDRDGVVTQYLYDSAKRQTGSTRNSITTSSMLDALGRPIKTTRTGSDDSVIELGGYKYNREGEMIAETNALNGVTQYIKTNDVSTGARIQITINPDGGTTTNFYYCDGSLKKTIGTAVFGTRYVTGIATNGGVSRLYNAEIKLTASGADTSECVTNFVDMLGRSYKTVYSGTAPLPTSTSTYNNKGQLIKQVEPDNIATLYQYNAKGEQEYTVIDMDQNGVLSGSDRIVQTVPDVAGAHGTDVRRTRSYVWDTDPNLVSMVESSVDGLKSWQTAYRDLNSGTPVTSSSQTTNGGTGSRTVTTTAPDGSYTISAYSYGQLASVTRYDSTGAQIGATTYTYDGHGRLYRTTDARNGATTYGYNNADSVTSVTTPPPGNGAPAQTTINLYDNTGRQTGQILPDGGSTTNVYLPNGLLARTSGSRTYPVGYSYDYAGRMKTMTNWSDYPTAGARVTTWNYDAYRGFLSGKIYDGGSNGPAYTYNVAGRMTGRTWARGVTSTYAYNKAGDLQKVYYSDATPGVTNGYDRRGRLVAVTNGPTICAMTYNNAGQLLTESYTGGPLNGLSVTNTYDTLMRRRAIGLASQPSTLTEFGYDNASRLRVVSGGTNGATYTYLANSPLVSQITFTNNGATRMTTTKQYDFVNRLQSISSTTNPSSPASSAGYSYNSANQRTRAAQADGTYWLYEYDALGQVKSGKKYWSEGTPVAGQQFEYSFDDIGNRTQAKAGGDAVGSSLRLAGYTNNTLNQLTSRGVPEAVDVMGLGLATNAVNVNGQSTYRKSEYFWKELSVTNNLGALWTNMNVSAAGESTISGAVFVPKDPEYFSYDPDGNLTQDGRWTYTWDAENRLLSMKSLSTTPSASWFSLQFGYDYKSRRVSKVVSNWITSAWSLVSTNRFAYDGWNPIARLDASQLLQSYLWGSDLSGGMQGAGGVGGLLALVDNTNGANFVAFDGNGNVKSLVRAGNGTVSANYEYGPFGEVIRATGPMARVNPFRWSTQNQDDETDLVMYPARPYSPSTGRWLSRDPIQEQGGLNLYGFVGNNPISRFDVLGLWWSNIHHDATKRWAIADGYPSDAAETIATWDELVDHGINAPWPIFGDQSYHFNRNRFGGPDTRLVHYTDHLGTAKRFCTASLGYDLPVPAAMQLGTGLHPLQDWVAHGDFGMHMDSIYVVHNGFSPQKEYGSPGDYPDMTWLDAVGTPDGRATSAVIHVINNAGFDYARFEPGIKRWTLTKQLTDSALAEFLGHVRNYGGCKCKSYFGVQ
jgi:RHS repeat-associated protein